MANVNVNSTSEAAYVRGLKWDFDGHIYTCKAVPESVKDKLKDIFEKWGIGYFGDKSECKGNACNVHVMARQFKRVEFTLDQLKPTLETESK